MEDVCSTIMACIISQKGGIPLTQIDADYKMLTGKSIPFKEYGFESLVSFLDSIQKITIKSGILHASSDRTTHLENLISRQKNGKVTKPKLNHNSYPKVWRYNNNHSKTAVIHNNEKYEEMCSVISRIILVHRGIELSQLNGEYKNWTGRFIPYWNYGYKNLRMLLNRMEGVSIISGVVRARLNSAKRLTNDKELINVPSANLPSRVKRPSHRQIHHHTNYSYRNEMFKSTMYIGISAIRSNSVELLIPEMVANLRHCGLENALHDTYVDRRNQEKNCYLDGYQVIGDNCVFQMVKDSYRTNDKSMGTCDPALTLKNAQKAVSKYGCSKRAIICCGTLDLHMNRPIDEMIEDMQMLLLCVTMFGCEPVVCTLPPSKIEYLNETSKLFNDWLVSLHFLRVVELHFIFHEKTGHNIDLEMFQRGSSTFNGHEYYSWSYYGRQAVQNTFCWFIRQFERYTF